MLLHGQRRSKKIKDAIGNSRTTWKNLDAVKGEIKQQRSSELKLGGEYTPANLAYKTLRKNRYIEMLRQAMKKRMEDELSLSEAVVKADKFFAQALLTNSSRDVLMSRVNGIPLDRDLHSTIIYSEKPVSLELPEVDKKTTFNARVIKANYWPGHDGDGFLILELDSPDLSRCHELFRRSGIIPTFPTYQPHITLVHPVANKDTYADWIARFNAELVHRPMHLQLYWGGISIT